MYYISKKVVVFPAQLNSRKDFGDLLVIFKMDSELIRKNETKGIKLH